VFTGGKYSPIGASMGNWRTFYGTSKEARSHKIVKFGVAVMKYCRTAVGSAKQILRTLAGRAEELDARAQDAAKEYETFLEENKALLEKIGEAKNAVNDLCIKLGRTGSKFPAEPNVPKLLELESVRDTIPFPRGGYNPLENAFEVDDPLLDVGEDHPLIKAMLKAQRGLLDADIYVQCKQLDEKKDKTGPESLLPRLSGTESDRATSLPKTIGSLINTFQSSLQRRFSDLETHHVS
jgi:hypothetical protein